MTIVLALFFLLAGTGVNYVQYCCSSCKAVGIVHVMAESCEAVHEHTHHHHDADCHHENGCQLHRLEVGQTMLAAVVDVPENDHYTHLFYPIYSEMVADMLPSAIDSYADVPIFSPDIPLIGRTVSIRDCAFLL